MSANQERAGYVLVNILLLAVALLIALGLNSCNTFQSAFRKYGHEITDTTTVTVPVVVTIPRDSAVITARTDTSRLVIEEHNKTSWVRLYRDKNQTRVEGGCDSATIARNAVAKVPQKQAVWGVDPSYKLWSDRWRTAALVLLALLGLGIGLYMFTQKFLITPRNGTGTPTQSN